MVSGKVVCRLFLIYFMLVLNSPVVGYQAILPLLLDENIFGNLCDSNDNDGCDEQYLRLDWMFNVTVAMINISGIFWGPISAKFGARKIALLGGLLITASSVILSFGWDWGVFICYIVIGMSGLGNIFAALEIILTQFDPSLAPFLLGLWIGAIDLSVGVFYLFYEGYKYFNISFQQLFIAYSILVFITTMINSLWTYNTNMFSKQQQQETKEQNVTKDDMNVNSSKASYVKMKSVDEKSEETMSLEDVKDPYYKAKAFYVIALWASLYMMVKYFYIQTVEKQLMWIDNTNGATTKYVSSGQEIISVMLLCGGLFTFISGPLIKKYGVKFNIILMGFLSLLAGILSVIKITYIQYITMILMVFLRFIFFAIIQMVIGGYFGQKKTAEIFGMILCIGGIFTLSGYVWDYIIVNTLNGSFFYFNLISSFACFLSALLLARST